MGIPAFGDNHGWKEGGILMGVAFLTKAM